MLQTSSCTNMPVLLKENTLKTIKSWGLRGIHMIQDTIDLITSSRLHQGIYSRLREMQDIHEVLPNLRSYMISRANELFKKTFVPPPS